MTEYQTVNNVGGEVWQLERSGSGALTTIGGYLMTYGSCSRITISDRLDAVIQERGFRELLEHLTLLPIGTSRVILWHPDD